MKILVIQLARLGDIYMSWPALRALRRNYPQAEIHVLTRPRFAPAFEGLTAIHKVIHLQTRDILAPMVQPQADIQASFDKLSEFVDQMHFDKYDWILNFSFSPLSSYLTHYIAHSETRISGYTRFKDGFLSIPDDMSAYFYAQVGVGRFNRFHLIEMFASLAELDIEAEDWRSPHPFPSTDKNLPQDYFVLHVGASEARKSISAQKWAEIYREFRQLDSMPMVLIGAAAEAPVAEALCAAFPGDSIINLVGKTQLSELFPILRSSRALVGCDSAPMHMAAFTNTPCLNISFASVNFWETGPRTIGSVIVRARSESELPADKTALAIHRHIAGEKQDISVVHTVGGTPSYYALMPKSVDFEWLFLRALYLREHFPSNEDKDFKEAIIQLSEINSLMIQQMEQVERTGDVGRASPFIERGEEIIETIGKLVPPTQSLVRWYQTEKIRIGPGEMPEVLAKTKEIHLLLQKILDLYKSYQMEPEKELR